MAIQPLFAAKFTSPAFYDLIHITSRHTIRFRRFGEIQIALLHVP